jgi:hypothetical protein
MAIIPYLPAILGALVQLAKLLYDLAREKNGDAIKQCSIEIERARYSGDASKLNEIIERMKKGNPCD